MRFGLLPLSVGLALFAVTTGCPAHASSAPPSRGRPANDGLSSAVSECLRLKDPAAGVAAYASDGVRLPFDVFAGHEPGTAPRCRPDELRVMRLETLGVGGRPTYLRRGGCQTPCVVRQATVHVPASAFSARITPLPTTARHGDGERIPDCEAPVHAAPQLAGRQLAEMFYKRPAETPAGTPRSADTGARWSNYGDPGRLYRAARSSAVEADYGYLLWNLPRTPRGVLHGGGIVEAVLDRGQQIALCSAQRLRLPAFDADGRPDGRVEFAYAEIRPEPGEAAYGWVMVNYTFRGHRQPMTT